MKLAYYTKKTSSLSDPRVVSMMDALRGGGVALYPLESRENLQEKTDAVLAIGGDGTFLSASTIVHGTGVPLLGVNLGRLGFLSENKPEDVAEPLLKGDFKVEPRTMLKVSCDGKSTHALNEVAVSRLSAAMLGIDVCLDGQPLPTYWADGLLISTSSGSTAYSLSVGGPICTPQSRVLIIAPVAPHNLNVRPLVVPETSGITIKLHSRDGKFVLAADNVNSIESGDSEVEVCASSQPLGIVTLGKSSFIEALRTKLFWGEDVRNSKD